ncbi:MAG: hypothetical protein GDA67_10030 [Nitrospira sp. CR1.3]|nr:hypothetical protein [Nitrospira sp. CR1.3]
MAQEKLDRRQLAGLDERERGFSRPVEFEREETGYRAVLRYEAVCVTTGLYPSQEAALLALIETLQSRGYRQLKTQISFRSGQYLGSQEPWVEYQDPPEAAAQPSGVIAKLLNWFCPRVRPSQT